MKRWMHIFGSLLGFVGVAFVAQRLYSYGAQIDFSGFNILSWAIIAGMTMAYGSANVLLAYAWQQILAFLDVKVSVHWAIKVYGQSQIAKYVPGNIVHLAGRQVLGMAAGYPMKLLIKSTVWELVLFTIAGVSFAALVLPLIFAGLSVYPSVALFLLSVLLLGFVANKIFSSKIAKSIFGQILFLVLSGILFVGALSVVVPNAVTADTFSTWCGAYVLAWLAGFVTPGAPAGVGVREMVLLFLLGGSVAQGDLLLAVVLGRVVTVLGDFCFFVMTFFLNPRTTLSV